jgi:pimeloyl-ACP methyl ester carboxylesterase
MRLRPLLSLVLAVAALAIPAGASAQTPSELLKPSLVDIGGRKLNFACAGKGSPIVIFEQGEDAAIPNWKKVLPSVAAQTRTCVYDRAGFGYSDQPDGPISGIAVNDNLRLLLKAQDIREPVVLVGHSIGGFYATLFADRFPAQVAGLVLVDPLFANQFQPKTEKQRQAWLRQIALDEAALVKCAAAASEGKLSASTPSGCITPRTDYTPEEAEVFHHGRSSPNWYGNALSQSQNFFPSEGRQSLAWRQAYMASRTYGATPVTVLTAEILPKQKWQRPADVQLMTEQWRAGHAALAARSSRGRHIVVPGSDHYIQISQPQAVIDAVTRTIEEVRAGKPQAAPAKPKKGKGKAKPAAKPKAKPLRR